MNHEPPIDPLFERLLADVPISRAPDRLRADVAAATRGKAQRRPWLTSLKEPPMRYRSRLVAGSPTLRLSAIIAITALLTLALGAAVIAGASPQPSPAPATSSTWVTGTIQPVDGSCSRTASQAGGGITHSGYE